VEKTAYRGAEDDEGGWVCSANGYSLLVGKPGEEGKKPLGRTRRRWVDNIKMYLVKVR
jgi:hypothetical protein